MKSKKLNDLSVSPGSNSAYSNSQSMHRDSVHYLDHRLNGFNLVESDDDSDSLASFNYPAQHSKIIFYESLLSRKPSKLFSNIKQDLASKTGLESNPVADLTESTYESFFVSPRKAKTESKHFSIKHFASLPKKKKSKPRVVGASFEDDSILEKKISPKIALDKVEESNKDDHSEEDAYWNRKDRVRFEEKFNSGSFRNQNTTSFPNLFSSVSAGQKKNVDFRSKDFLNSVLQPKVTHAEKYNFKADPVSKYSKLVHKRKNENSTYNSNDFKFGNDESLVMLGEIRPYRPGLKRYEEPKIGPELYLI
ncbi:hypothetical protein BpHYR1_009994 [Brachionus plicatilis]|uniref:Uncharacterized protein n=1 Tax=Brachionus plicatilis TaxID=10195 RepID=A0A3M7PC63_BRAPC|nr:hypothetical protein BpHYR1_009994 [Brachionus plicatilis]